MTATKTRVQYSTIVNSIQVNPAEYENQQVVHYSIPVIQETGAPALETASEIASNKWLLNGGEVLVSKLNVHKNCVAIVEKNSAVPVLASTEFVALTPVSIEPRYLKYVFQSDETVQMLSSLSESATRSHARVNPSDIIKFKAYQPSPEAQRVIADYLDCETARIDALVAEKETMLARLDEKRAALIGRAVTRGLGSDIPLKHSGYDWLGEVPAHWRIWRLKYLAAKIGSGITPRGGSETYQRKGIPLLRSQNVHFDGLRLEDVVYIDRETHESMSNSKVLNGDVLINITGASIGRCFHVEDLSGEANVNQHVCIVRPSTIVKTKFLYFVLRSDVGQYQIDLSQSGSGREGLNFESLGNFFIPAPPLEEQNAIVEFLETTERRSIELLNEIRRSIDRLKERRLALITAAVAGRIPVEEMKK